VNNPTKVASRLKPENFDRLPGQSGGKSETRMHRASAVLTGTIEADFMLDQRHQLLIIFTSTRRSEFICIATLCISL
jgi:hypothetical protein